MEIFSSIGTAFLQGGIWMWFILVLQLVSIAIIVERYQALYKKRKPSQKKTALSFASDIRKGDMEAVASKLPADADSTLPIHEVIKVGMDNHKTVGGLGELQGKIEEVLMDERVKLEKRTGFLSMLGNVGTLAGLLGTIIGMIKSFSAVGKANPMEKATLLSQGISEAMNTTAYGLIMAIPALLMYAVLMNRTSELLEDLEQGALRVFNWFGYDLDHVFEKSQGDLPQGMRTEVASGDSQTRSTQSAS